MILKLSNRKSTIKNSQLINCPLCNYEFDEKSENCHTACPMSNGCPLVKCPNCGYEFVTESKTVNFFKKIFVTIQAIFATESPQYGHPSLRGRQRKKV